MKADDSSYDLDRFVDAQYGVYPIALKELENGRKLTHWMWFIFPQIKGLGHSYNSSFYGLYGREEALAYLHHPVLSERLRAVTRAVLSLDCDDITEVFGHVDSLKLRSSMTIFDLLAPDDIFGEVIDRFFNARRDPLTLEIARNSA